MKNIKVIIAVVIIIIVLVIVFNLISGKSEEEITNDQKKSSIDTMFAIWLTVAGEGDKKTMMQNEVAIKKDLYDRLTLDEVLSLKIYSTNLKMMLDNKTRPLSSEFIGSSAYLVQNFNTAKEIISKTGMKDIFNRISGKQ